MGQVQDELQWLVLGYLCSSSILVAQDCQEPLP